MNDDRELTVYEFSDKPITMEQKRDYFLKKSGNILKVILSFLIVAVCAVVTAWMVYNIFTTGSAFPPDLSSYNGVVKDLSVKFMRFRS